MKEWKELNLDYDVYDFETEVTGNGVKIKYRELEKEPIESEIIKEYIENIDKNHHTGFIYELDSIFYAVKYLLEQELAKQTKV